MATFNRALTTVLIVFFCFQEPGFAQPTEVAAPPNVYIASNNTGGWDVWPTGGDDSQNIQWALANAQDGSKVRLFEGDYFLGAPVLAMNFFGTLKGAGESKTTIHMMSEFGGGFRLFDFQFDDTDSPYDFSTMQLPVVVADFTLRAEVPGLVDGLWFYVTTTKSQVEANTFFGTYKVAYVDITVRDVSVLGKYDINNPQWGRFQRNSIANGVSMQPDFSTTISGRYTNDRVTIHNAIAPASIGWNLYEIDANFTRVNTYNRPPIDIFNPDGSFNPDYELIWLGAGISVFDLSDSNVSIEHCSTMNSSIVALGMEDGGSLVIRDNTVNISGFVLPRLQWDWATYSGIARGSHGPNPPATVIQGNTVNVGIPSLLVYIWGPIDSSGISIWGSNYNTEIAANRIIGPDDNFGFGTSIFFAEGLLYMGNQVEGFPHSVYLGGSTYFGSTSDNTILGNAAGVNETIVDYGVNNVVVGMDNKHADMVGRVSEIQDAINDEVAQSILSAEDLMRSRASQ